MQFYLTKLYVIELGEKRERERVQSKYFRSMAAWKEICAKDKREDTRIYKDNL